MICPTVLSTAATGQQIAMHCLDSMQYNRIIVIYSVSNLEKILIVNGYID